ncbi:hypothetical protein SAMN04487981_103372 [Streptomyces sp. cf386]|uniref:hypothetical protein n=1 Tax=Streptomyces sp. cf386 TaxID=1761904 RepID=UPI0008837C07|nr:hypothetical protein [Streptomyces sp. cf386]SDN04670.1 hypothetical protein SAMN04487981_103372 [Streptomyces sp. cf386]
MSYGQQGGPQSQWDPWKPHSQQPWSSGGGDETPDWAALAEASESRNKRRRLLFIGGGALATIAVGTAVAVAVVSANSGNSADNNPTSGQSGTAALPGATAKAPSFASTSAPPPLDPKDFVSDKSKDTAPLGAQILFPGTQLTEAGTLYKKGATDDTKSCSAVAKGGLPKILTANDCTRMLRVSYVKGGIAVTVGVAVFDTEAQATKAASKADPQKDFLRSLSGKGIGGFCNSTVCLMSANSYGRYAYFTITGFTSGKDVTNKDTAVYQTSNNLKAFTFRQIRTRGEVQASAAANE